MTFSLHEGGVVTSQMMRSQLYNIHPLAHIIGTCDFLDVSSCVFFSLPKPHHAQPALYSAVGTSNPS